MLATYAASRHRQIVPCCMISSVSHDNVSRLVTDRSMCFATALDKAFENIDCMSAILRYQAKNRFYESTQRLIQPRRVLCRNLYFLNWFLITTVRFTVAVDIYTQGSSPRWDTTQPTATAANARAAAAA